MYNFHSLCKYTFLFDIKQIYRYISLIFIKTKEDIQLLNSITLTTLYTTESAKTEYVFALYTLFIYKRDVIPLHLFYFTL